MTSVVVGSAWLLIVLWSLFLVVTDHDELV
jgi:hypothetical protein